MPMDFTSIGNIIKKGLSEQRIYNLRGSSAALLLALCGEPFLAVESTEELARELYADTNFFRDVLKKDHALFLPEPNGPSVAGERANLVNSLKGNESVICSFKSLQSKVWPWEDLAEKALNIRNGMVISRQEIEERLRGMGYTDVPLVSGKGEYSRRGWLLDVFPSTSETPMRLEFFGDEIDIIKIFDVDTQRSTGEVSFVLMLPAADPASGTTPLGLMRWVKYFFSDSIHEKDGLPEDGVFFTRYSIQGPGYNAETLPLKGLGMTPEERKDIGDLPVNIKPLLIENRIAIVCSSAGQAERLKDILMEGGIVAPLIDKGELYEYEGTISITLGSLSAGVHLPGFLILTEKEIFGERPNYRPIKKSKISGLLTSLDDLRPGDFIVHKDHGIGRFHSLVQQSIEGIKEDLVQIEYEGGRLYLPLQSINKISKYHSEEGITPKVDRLGGKTWQKTKERVKKKIQEMAEKLVGLYAERKLHKGFTFSPDTELHREFDSFFPYEETPDQLKAIADIKRDMESDKPVDRLICGDVGYGKTEVAMRAAFKAVYDGMQVVMLVPTTILCEQHLRTFKSRFSAFPVHIDYISRFKPAKDRKKTIKALSDGDIDIIIGTHSLLGKDLHFHNLGLLIIDEEHRFGVGQKEKIKELKKGIDVITLTATPIPRTLHMALSDIREMSVIETPPEERLAVKSIVSLFDETLIKDAIKKELDRGGQVFFVHNRIKDIYKIADYIMKLVPSLRMDVAHGQMDGKELERVMLKFYERETDMLVSTAIIGSGLDIPTANTIIINRADAMGLADLYQLRGRVGRGNAKAYAYFLVPGEDIITNEAKQRLQAIQDMSYLGAGFRLALRDLEIRGAGNLLGAEQSGHIHAVGFDLYIEMLEKAVAELKGIKIEEEFEPSINLKVNAFIPEEYIADITLRLSLYRRVASSKTPEALKAIEAEMDDRFGRLPGEVKNLINIMSLKLTARDLLITKVREANGTISVIFSPDTKVEPKDIFGLRDKTDGNLRFLPEGFEVDIKGMPWDKVYDKISCLFTCLSVSDTFKKV
jgi:transcription-repair coupling factor (superfamily II helicase)